MLRPFANITIQQIPNQKWSSRNSLFVLDFFSSYTISKGWEDHTDTSELTFPKNVILPNDEYLFRNQGTNNVILGLSSNINDEVPLILKGDIIQISDGYRYKNEFGNNNIVGNTVYTGYISRTFSEVPIRIELEDNFYLLKRTPLDVNNWKGNLIDLCKHIINLVNKNFNQNSSYNINGVNPYPELSVSEVTDSLTANFSLGYLDIGEATCAQVLSKIRTNYGLESFFIGNELRFGFPIYNESTANNQYVFEFRNNILDDADLEYMNKDDIQLSAVVNCKVISKTGSKTSYGSDRTKIEKLSILVYWDVQSQSFKYLTRSKSEKFPDNETGERRTFIYPVDPNSSIPTESELFDFGSKQLEKYFYSGFRGSFLTFGFPFINWGDNITIIDPILKDRSGVYKVKKVIRTGGNGTNQEIFLDYKLNIPVKQELFNVPYTGTQIYMI